MEHKQHPDITARRAVPKLTGGGGYQPSTPQEIEWIVKRTMVAEGLDPAGEGMAQEVSIRVVKILKGLELRLAAIESLTAIYAMDFSKEDDSERKSSAVVFGVSAWAQRALVFSSGQLEMWDVETDHTSTVQITVKRVGFTAQSFRHHLKEFKHRQDMLLRIHRRKGRTGTPNHPWFTHPMRMVEARTTTTAIRAVFPDFLHGMLGVDEASEVHPALDEHEAETVREMVAKERVEANAEEESLRVEMENAAPRAATTIAPVPVPPVPTLAQQDSAANGGEQEPPAQSVEQNPTTPNLNLPGLPSGAAKVEGVAVPPSTPVAKVDGADRGDMPASFANLLAKRAAAGKGAQ